MRRTNVSRRRVTHMEQNTVHCKDEIADFTAYVNEQIANLNIESKKVFNWDETKVYLSMDFNITLDFIGARTVAVQLAKTSQRATVFLFGVIDCRKISLLQVSKGSKLKIYYPTNTIYAVQ